jgi:hypothetical protein
MTPATPYLFFEIWVPKRAPYSGPRNDKDRLAESYSWPSIVGDFVKPLVERWPDSLWWQVQEGPFYQVCVAPWTRWSPLHEDPERYAKEVERSVRAHCKTTGFRMKRLLRGTLGTALAGDRWNRCSYDLCRSKEEAQRQEARSVLLVQTMDRVCRLYMDTLVKVPHRRVKRGQPTHHWVTEVNGSRQNPHGNIFESLMHLLANTGEPRFDVKVQVNTPWMRENPLPNAKLTCHL